ncbi:VOC family protein [Reichenbachiella agarivorans]|uniref:VOC family protein n=1 Tax=Reichenbachiella agarivorans TaxID=2979464 RepID=A0ABY6CU17_9BACT|nr:VOC family protein [Reichenbachiella agarivorans]UXP34017.1 VOC family protein [Reichenbachiella agarivorans]
MTQTQQLRTLLLLIVCLSMMFHSEAVFSQKNINELRFSSATIIVKDLKTSASWYRKFLQFSVEEYRPDKYVKMKNDDFRLILKQGNSTLLKSQINFKEGKKYINGITKLGFATNQFDSLYMYLQKYEQIIVKDIHDDINLGLKSYVTLDPDGNLLQFFDIPNQSRLYQVDPMYFTIQSSDYINTLKWYTTHMGFEEIEIVDDSNIHFQNLLRKDGIILELVHLPHQSVETTEFMPLNRDLAQIEELSFKIGLAKTKAFELDNNGNKVVFMK